ncbi:ferric reductase-like transmembrane domain-containing protein [Candidatus Daviesbacteria bacterium]|nr:ferric reductase-like transmembrane domain-containing protein [Candidatus Daviesbacteria bacterium]
MAKQNPKIHPYHYQADKNLIQKLLDWAVPIGLFLLYFELYNFGKFTPSEMVKTTGLMGISLLALTLVVGPIARFIPALDILKAHRKFWGVASTTFIAIHLGLVFVYYLKFNFWGLFNTGSPRFLGFAVGDIALLILLIVTLTSNKWALKSLNPKVWKAIQTTSYIALILAVGHFFLMEQVNGVLVIKRLLGNITFWFAAAVVLIRLIVLALPHR